MTTYTQPLRQKWVTCSCCGRETQPGAWPQLGGDDTGPWQGVSRIRENPTKYLLEELMG